MNPAFIFRSFSAAAALCLCGALLCSQPASAAPGDLDLTFGTGGRVLAPLGSGNGYVTAAAVQNDGKIVVAGYINKGVPGPDFLLARFNPDGAPDVTFGVGGTVTIDIREDSFDRCHAVLIQEDGKIIAAGNSGFIGPGSDFALMRCHADGSLDNTFGNGGKVVADGGGTEDIGLRAAAQGDGKILLLGSTRGDPAGSEMDTKVLRFTPEGKPDAGFGKGGVVTFSILPGEYISPVAILPRADGTVLLAGDVQSTPGGTDFGIVCLAADGSADERFGVAGRTVVDFGGNDYPGGLAVREDGRIILAGVRHAELKTDLALARCHPDGSLDETFGTGGKVTEATGEMDVEIRDLIPRADGGFLIGGTRHGDGEMDFVLLRRTAEGEADSGFGVRGRVVTDFGSGDRLYAVAEQPGGRIIATGYSDRSPNRIELAGYSTAAGPSVQEVWRQKWFGAAENSGNAADAADPDGDGLENLLEWALGLNPLAFDAPPLELVHNGPISDMNFTFRRGQSAFNAGAVCVVEWRDDLSAGTWSTEVVGVFPGQGDDLTRQVMAIVPSPYPHHDGTGSRRFVRLRVKAP